MLIVGNALFPLSLLDWSVQLYSRKGLRWALGLNSLVRFGSLQFQEFIQHSYKLDMFFAV